MNADIFHQVNARDVLHLTVNVYICGRTVMEYVRCFHASQNIMFLFVDFVRSFLVIG